MLLHVLSLLTANGPVFRVIINIRCLQELNTTASGTKTRDEFNRNNSVWVEKWRVNH